MTPRLGVFGGTFDPVHNAHLAMAAAALSHLRLERLLWIPTGVPPYREAPVAAAEHRVAMLRLAIAGEPRYQVDTRELSPGASGYTVDTLRSLRAELPPEALLYLLMGADQYSKLGSWQRPDEIRRLARLAVVARPGWPAEGDVERVPMEPMPISASELRSRAARGESIAGLVPAAVEDYLFRYGLYA